MKFQILKIFFYFLIYISALLSILYIELFSLLVIPKTLITSLFIPRLTIVAGYYGFTLDVSASVLPSIVHLSVRFSFPDDNLSKHQWIFTKLGMCIDIVEIWFGIANGQISSNFYGVICLRHAHIFVSGG